MPGAVRSHHGTKIIDTSVSNPAAGLERAGGPGLRFGEETARITTIMEAGLLSAVRTAAVSAVGVDTPGYAGAASLVIVDRRSRLTKPAACLVADTGTRGTGVPRRASMRDLPS